ncbi:MAG: hypothetical protein ACTSSP_10405 [Candidatus Asgardarchaeia archaeon]
MEKPDSDEIIKDMEIDRLRDEELKKERWLVCGSRKKGKPYPNYRDLVFKELDKMLSSHQEMYGEDWKPECIISGCCPDSADVFAEEWANNNGILVERHLARKGGFLFRNIEMVKSNPSEVIAFWDKFSYGTCHTIATAILYSKSVCLIEISS